MNGLPNAQRSQAKRLASRASRFGALLIATMALTGCTLTDLFGVQPNEGAPVSPDPPPAEVGGDLLQVDSVEVLILESFPVQVNVVVRGTVPDACTEVGEVSQERVDNEIEVLVYLNRDPNAFCAQVLTPVEETLSIPGDFPPGDYSVTVNGVTETFRV